MSDSTVPERDDLLEAIIARAWEDPGFKAALVTNPRNTLKGEFGFDFPEDVTPRVVEETATERWIVLPFRPHTGGEGEEASFESRVPKRDNLVGAVISRARQDPDFKAGLVADPRNTLKGEFGIELHEDVTLTVVEETATEPCLILPFRPHADEEGEMSESELEVVAGGVTGSSACVFFPTRRVVGGGSLSSLACSTYSTNLRFP